jgi:ElaB/YqjD/DUF883 family membrane-anchored ribosome-binding protein
MTQNPMKGQPTEKALDTSLNDQPMATLALATIVGFFLGAIWKA